MAEIDYDNIEEEYFKEYKRIGGSLEKDLFMQVISVFNFLFPDVYCFDSQTTGLYREDVCELYIKYLQLYFKRNSVINFASVEFDKIFSCVDNITALT